MHVNVGLWLISGQRGDKQGSSLLSQLVPEMSIGVDPVKEMIVLKVNVEIASFKVLPSSYF